MPRIPLPDELGDAFTVADARAHDIGIKRLRGSDLARPFRGVRSRTDAPPVETTFGDTDGIVGYGRRREAVVREALLFALRMPPGHFFSHSTAAIIWGAPLPFLGLEELHVSVLAPLRLPRVPGVRGHEAQPTLTRVVVEPSTGLRVSSPASTWAMLGGQLRHPYDLVAAGDHFVRVPRMPGAYDKPVPPPLCDLFRMRAAVYAGRRVGGPALRAALPLLRTGASSRPETWTRLILVDAGLPEPVLDHDVWEGGVFLGCVDLAYPELRIAIEYEGDHHRTDPAAWQRDIDKHDALAAAGWRVIRVARSHVFRDPAVVVARVRAARAARSRA